jgi:hypothetical protein
MVVEVNLPVEREAATADAVVAGSAKIMERDELE